MIRETSDTTALFLLKTSMPENALGCYRLIPVQTWPSIEDSIRTVRLIFQMLVEHNQRLIHHKLLYIITMYSLLSIRYIIETIVDLAINNLRLEVTHRIKLITCSDLLWNSLIGTIPQNNIHSVLGIHIYISERIDQCSCQFTFSTIKRHKGDNNIYVTMNTKTFFCKMSWAGSSWVSRAYARFIISDDQSADYMAPEEAGNIKIHHLYAWTIM